ncbi:multiple epidermal growth factor-like domains protein 6 [Haliotis rufescens]|uniref:multiple epidermal growth factor-like domains protein 6 n=1 Tax=Haliotis rufescens TaxID=6454 RepID=UPI00201F47B0|nr:multiple epidermal growth factor-like domains protein 6 [Haliotis rufescens]
METRLLAYCWIVIIATFIAGSESCVDTLGDQCKKLDCSQPGIDVSCAKTCATCREEESCVDTLGDHCKTVDCSQPGIDVVCAKTCATCREEESCVDTFGDQCKKLDCSQPGIDVVCEKTCATCREEGCANGYYSTAERICESCAKPPVSHRTDSYNSSCVQECPDGKWGLDCNTNCGIGCKSTCRRWTGLCHGGCKRCYWGPKCNHIHDGCICNQTAGECMCKEGHYGETCDTKCSPKCEGGVCDTTGTCSRGCKEGWSGKMCDHSCINCLLSKCMANGTCTEGCKAGFYGNLCQVACNKQCHNSTCRWNTGECDEGCTGGWYGGRCDIRCPGNCASELCDRTNGACSHCQNSSMGSNCTTPCPRNCDSKTCEQNDGRCVKCTVGYSGSNCDTPCPHHCATDACEQHGANCTGCKPGYKGPHCDTRCPDKCSSCHQSENTCISCNANWYGGTCGKSCNTCLNGTCNITDGACLYGCKPGSYGHRCNRTCNENCLKTECFRDSGNCTHGCKDGWWGPQCNSRCPSHCARCDRVDAACLECEENYYGENCSSRCSPRCGSCDGTGHCLTCAEGWEGDNCHASKSLQPSTLIWTSVVAILLLIIVAMTIKIVSKRRKAVYLSPRFEDNVYSSVDDVSLYELAEPRDSTGSQYATIPDAAVSLEDRGYEQLRQASPCTGYTSLYTDLVTVTTKLTREGGDTRDLGRRGSMETRLFAYCWIVIIATFRAGSGTSAFNQSCVDTLGDHCKTVDCSQPGITVSCAKTCAICREKGCAKGYYNTAERNCESCANPPASHHTDSYNSSCLEECPDGKWGLDCNINCGIGCTSTCRRWTGTCHGGCKRCYFGANCNQTYERCICDQTGGGCMCKEGHYGETCVSKCSPNCEGGVCDTKGTCSRGCKKGWSGKMCDKSCTNCLLSKCMANGTCTQTCKAGFYGNLCQVACNKQCHNITCRGNTGECDEGCTAGWYGGRCDIRCPGNCASELCDRTDGTCVKCKVGYSGSHCDTPCPGNCATKTCKQKDGTCAKCTVGYRGSHCDTPCPDHCVTDACEQHGASCTGCKPGYKGPHCDTRCPDKCSSCHQSENTCISCNANWYGGTCGKSCNTCLNGTCNINDGACLYGCKPGSYGHRCNRTCNANCLRRECFRDSGNCTHGCKDSWWGPQCNSRCPSHCARCDRVDAACLECEENYYGENCSSRCSPRCGSCDGTGHCLTCAEGLEGHDCQGSTRMQMLWIVIPCLLIAILFVLAFFVLRRSNMKVQGKIRSRCFAYSSKQSTVLAIDNPTFETTPKGCQTPVDAVAPEIQPLMSGGREHSAASTEIRMNERQRTRSSLSHSLTSSYTLKSDVSRPRTNCTSGLVPTPHRPADTSYPECVWSTEVPVQHLNSYVAKMKIDEGLTKQFFDLPYGKLGSCDEAEMPGNAFKNRYRNILPYDHCRVKLGPVHNIPGSDYINANYIHGYGRPRAFVATQGPYGDVVWDFWRMIWETETSKIVMLTNFVENRKAKCEKYWPDFGHPGSNYDDVHVQCVAEEEMMDYTVRTFSIHRDEEPTRTLKHYHFTAWPDKGVPEDVGMLVEFHRLVKNAPSRSKGPVVVHCSAGIGRTGTWIALDYLIGQAKAEGVVDVYECIVRLRHQRMDLIQTEAQYIFLHDVLVEVLLSCDKKKPMCKGKDKVSDDYAVVQKRKRNPILEQENDKYRHRIQLPLPEIPSLAVDSFQDQPRDRRS